MDEYWRSALDWVEAEHAAYEGDKFDREEDDLKTAKEWSLRVDNYLVRAEVLGLDNPLGRQAVGKAATTAVAYLESMFRRFGGLPSPGFTSGTQAGEFKGGEHRGTEET
jgi:hypothetical protein